MARQTTMTKVAGKNTPKRPPKLLGAIRLSQYRDEAQTGVEKQRESIGDYARSVGVDLDDIMWSEDTNVSGSKSPFERPELKPYLTEPSKIAQWDEMVAMKLDRFGRSARDLQNLRNWCTDNGKKLTVTSLNLHWPAEDGIAGMPSRVMWDLLGELAQAELEGMTERRLDTTAYGRKVGRWMNTKPRFGYRSIPNPHGNGRIIDPDPAQTKLVHEMADRILAGESATSIAKDFTSRDIPTGNQRRPRIDYIDETGKRRWTTDKSVPTVPNTVWHPDTITGIMRSPTLKGFMVTYIDPETGKVRRMISPITGKEIDAPPEIVYKDGAPFRAWKPILDDDKWDRVQDALDGLSRPKFNLHPDAMLSQIAECPCGSLMGQQNFEEGPKNRELHYYRPYGKNGGGDKHRAIDMKLLNDAVDTWMVNHSFNITERVIIPGDDYSKDIARLEAQAMELNADWYQRKIRRPNHKQLLESIDAQIADLEAKDPKPETVEYKPTGKTIASEWPKWSPERKHDFLRDYGIRIIATRVADEWGILDANRRPVKCTCGKPGVTSVGTCKGSASKNSRCHKTYTRRQYENNIAVKAGQPKPWDYDPDEIHVIVIPSWLYEARARGITVEDDRDYNERVEAMWQAGTIPAEWRAWAMRSTAVERTDVEREGNYYAGNKN